MKEFIDILNQIGVIIYNSYGDLRPLKNIFLDFNTQFILLNDKEKFYLLNKIEKIIINLAKERNVLIMLNSSDVLELFIGETESKFGCLIGIAPIGSSIDISLNQGQIKILLNKYQLKRVVENLTKLLSLLDFKDSEKE